MKKLDKFGKKIQYEVKESGSWLHVREGRDNWLYVTKNVKLSENKDVLNISQQNRVEPIFLNRKGMFDLLVHFGCEGSSNVFKKKTSV